MSELDAIEGALKPSDIAAGIRRELATIRRFWKGTANPPKSAPGGARGVPESRMPGNDTAISLRAEVVRDLAFWVHAFVDEHPDSVQDWVIIDALDVPRTCRFLAEHADALGQWSSGNRMWDELETLAREVRACAAPPRRDTMMMGECPECETPVRAKIHNPGEVKCRGCGITDTVDGWIIRIVGNQPLVTAEQLVPILHKRMGIVATRAGIRQWVARGVIPTAGTDDRGRTMFERKAVFAALLRRETLRDGTQS